MDINIPTCDVMVNSFVILTVSPGRKDGGSGNISLDYSSPVKLVQGDRLDIRSNRANCFLRVAFLGYLVQNDLI